MNFTLYTANCIGNPQNCSYPHEINISDEKALLLATNKDYVCASYRNNYRGNDNFLSSDCLAVDCDNDHSNKPNEWVTPADVATAFPRVAFAVHYSRHHMKEKAGHAPRPKFHILFPIEQVWDAKEYSDLKKMVNQLFPYFDNKALDCARFFFGTGTPQVEFHEGSITLSEFLEEFDRDMNRTEIAEGSRNATLSRFAGKVLKRYGDNEKSYQCFLEESAKCTPQLEEDELNTIWRSAQKFYTKVQSQDGYIAPEDYEESYKPGDYSDVGQAEMLAKHFSSELRYSPATHYIRYTDHYWQETEPGAQAVAHELTRRQLSEATADVLKSIKAMDECGASALLENTPKSKVKLLMNETQREVYEQYMSATSFQSYAIKRRDSKYITATLKEARPMLEIEIKELDANPFLLCTPNATYDIRKGMDGAKEHSPDDFITKITTVSPSEKGKELWKINLKT